MRKHDHHLTIFIIITTIIIIRENIFFPKGNTKQLRLYLSDQHPVCKRVKKGTGSFLSKTAEFWFPRGILSVADTVNTW